MPEEINKKLVCILPYVWLKKHTNTLTSKVIALLR